MFLVPTGIITALIAREDDRAAASTSRTSLFQGALLYTTQIWRTSRCRRGRRSTSTMGKTYPPGVHQEMIFEVADNEYVHASIMSGLRADEDAGRDPRPRPTRPIPMTLHDAARPRSAPSSRRSAARRTRQRERDELDRRVPREQPRDRGDRVDGGRARRRRRSRTRSSSPTTWSRPSTIPSSATPRRSACRSTCSARRARSRVRSRRPGQHNDEILGELGYSDAEIADVQRGWRDARARRCAPRSTSASTSPGPFGPMIIGDLGADVIKVEPVTGDGMRMASKPFFGCQRGKRDIALDLKNRRGLEIALAARRARRHRAPQHDRRRRDASSASATTTASAVKPDIVYCNTWAYGLEGPLAHFGGLDPLYQASAGLEYEQGPVREGNAPIYYRFGMTDTAERDALGRRRASPRCTTSARTGEGQELWTSLLDGGAMFASDALLVDGEAGAAAPARQGARPASTRCYRLYETQEGWIQIAAVKDARVGRAVRARSACPSSPTTRASRPRPRAPRTAGSSSRCSSRASARKTAIVWTRALDDAGVPERGPDRHAGRRARALRRRQRARSGSSPSTSTRSSAACASSATLIDFSETPGHIHGPPPLVGEHTRRDPRVARLRRRRDATSSRPSGVVYWPDDNYAWTV